MKPFILCLLVSLSLRSQPNLQICQVASGMGQVVDITNAGDERLFVLDKAGYIRILWKDGGKVTIPFLNISTKVLNNGERGLLGLAFHPQYAINGQFFVNYINGDNETVIARYAVSATDSSLADPASEQILMTIPQPYTNHNGGDLNFGPDGFLYIGLGDGGSGGDPLAYGQNNTVPFGKMLRIDVDQGTGNSPDYPNGTGYTIPPSNPFLDGPGGNLDEIWSTGLRNPWRFSFDRQTGDMWIGDVGQGAWEEINLEPAGGPGGYNYGWRCYEGNHIYNNSNCPDSSLLIFPVFEYNHSTGCSVNGGFMYRGTDFSAMNGRYFYTDFCSNKIWSLRQENGDWINEEEFVYPSGSSFTTMGEDNRGELYMGNLGGFVYRIVDDNVLTNLPNLTKDENPVPSGAYFAGDQLNAAGRVASDGQVIFNAAGSVLLNAGFKTEEGAVFQAQTGACSYRSVAD